MSDQQVHLDKLSPAHQVHINGYLKYFRRRLLSSQNEVRISIHSQHIIMHTYRMSRLLPRLFLWTTMCFCFVFILKLLYLFDISSCYLDVL